MHDSEFDHRPLDQLPFGVFHRDKAGRFTFANSWFCRFRGIPVEAFIGQTPGQVAAAHQVQHEGVPARAREMEVAGDDAARHELILQAGQTLEREERHIDLDGKERYLHTIAGPLFGRDAEIIGTQTTLLDITGRKQVEAQLASERDLLCNLLSSSPDAIYFKDIESRFIRTSAMMAQLFNCRSADDLIGKTDFDFFEAEHAQQAFDDEQKIIRTGQAIIGKVEKETHPDGHVTWALSSKIPLRNSQDGIIGTFGISKDITALKQAEAKLEELHRELVDTSRQAGMAEVATSVLHNVGNVLNSVNVSATLISQQLHQSKVSSIAKLAAMLQEHEAELGQFLTVDPRGKMIPSYLQTLAKALAAEQSAMEIELDHLGKNIEHIKDIVMMQQSYARVSGIIETVSVTELIEDALRINAGSLTQHKVEIIRDYQDEPHVTTDKYKVMQILINLISNAGHACNATGRNDKQITVQLAGKDSCVTVTVVDNGTGIPPENLTRIFNHGFTTRKGGHGFGLHSGALAANELGGSLVAQSDGVGKGATFILELPRLPSGPQPLEAIR
jgi:PAS domain S-box-containing protein